MSRNKSYNEQEVLEKALNVFWKNGYETTSMLQLEKEMGINMCSIYSSFVSKMGLMQVSIKYDAQKLKALVEKLQNMAGGADTIQQYFYDFIHFPQENNLQKGCLFTNTANECNEERNAEIQELLSYYTTNIKDVFTTKLRESKSYSEEEVQQKADFLFIAMFGFSSASKSFANVQLDNYIQHIFKNA